MIPTDASVAFYLAPILLVPFVFATVRLLVQRSEMTRKIAGYREQNLRYEKVVQDRNVTVETDQAKSKQEMNRISSQLVQLKDFARKLGASADEHEIFAIIHDHAVAILDVERSAFLEMSQDGSGDTLVIGVPPRGWTVAEMTSAIKKRPHPFETVIRERRIYVRIRPRDGGAYTPLASQDTLEAAYIQPIIHGDQFFGMLILSEPKRADVRQASAIFSILGDLGGIALENAAFVRRIREQAVRDGLTGLYNHRYFQDYLTRALVEAPIVTLLLADIDHFKKFNDTHGHQTGDAVLRKVAEVAAQVVQEHAGKIPDMALLARYGGEEFVVVLPGLSEPEGAALAELLRARVESTPLEYENQVHRITLSIGVAAGARGDDKSALIKRSDEALYESKQEGRNRVTISSRDAASCDGAMRMSRPAALVLSA